MLRSTLSLFGLLVLAICGKIGNGVDVVMLVKAGTAPNTVSYIL